MKHLLLLALGCAVALASCGKGPDPSTGTHTHVPPHGGSAVELGSHEFQLEFVRDDNAGRVVAYVLDGHMEFFIRIPAESFELEARVGGQPRTLLFKAVANTATGETVGNTSMFEASADWLKTAGGFDALLKEFTILGRKFTNVAFRIESKKPGGIAP